MKKAFCYLFSVLLFVSASAHSFCNVACYSMTPNGYGYNVGGGVYYIGTLRVQGYYDDQHHCQPKGLENTYLPHSWLLKDMCNSYYAGCQYGYGCWADSL